MPRDGESPDFAKQSVRKRESHTFEEADRRSPWCGSSLFEICHFFFKKKHTNIIYTHIHIIYLPWIELAMLVSASIMPLQKLFVAQLFGT